MPCVYSHLLILEGGTGLPRAGVAGSCGLPNMDTGNQTLGHWNSSNGSCWIHWTISPTLSADILKGLLENNSMYLAEVAMKIWGYKIGCYDFLLNCPWQTLVLNIQSTSDESVAGSKSFRNWVWPEEFCPWAHTFCLGFYFLLFLLSFPLLSICHGASYLAHSLHHNGLKPCSKEIFPPSKCVSDIHLFIVIRKTLTDWMLRFER